MDEEQIDRREFAATQKVSGRASRELLESLAFHRKPRRGPMSERIVNGVCTTCKGDAYLFYDAAGGHCWKCDVAAAEARAVRAEGERDAWMRVAAAWLIQAYGSGHGVAADLVDWAEKTLAGEHPWHVERIRAAIAGKEFK